MSYNICPPFNSYLLNIGIESLPARMRVHCENALKVATYLKNHPKVEWIHYPGLEDDKYHEAAKKYMPRGTCGVMCFGLKGDKKEAVTFMDHLQLINIVTHVADAKTCILHPASHTHRQMTDEQLKEAGVDPTLIRLSIGLENPDDLIKDIEEALKY